MPDRHSRPDQPDQRQDQPLKKIAETQDDAREEAEEKTGKKD